MQVSLYINNLTFWPLQYFSVLCNHFVFLDLFSILNELIILFLREKAFSDSYYGKGSKYLKLDVVYEKFLNLCRLFY